MANALIFENKNFDNDGIKNLYSKATSLTFPWYLNKSTVSEKMFGSNFDEMYFSHQGFGLGERSSEVMNDISSIFEKFCNSVGINTDKVEIIRAQLNLSPKAIADVSIPHADQDFDHKVFLCYLNDSDGDTILYEEVDKSESYTIQQQISPEFGKAIVFNGRHYHSMTFPKEHVHRMVINVDFIDI